MNDKQNKAQEFLCILDQMTVVRSQNSDWAFLPVYNMVQDDPYATPECQELCNDIEIFLQEECGIQMTPAKDCRDRAEQLREKLAEVLA